MKKSLVALATMTVVASAFADVDVSGGIKMYGVLDQAVTSQTYQVGSSGTINTYQGLYASAATSRLGFKGSRDLGDGFKADILAEIQLDPQATQLLPNKNRSAWVGITNSDAGTIRLGTQETTAYEVFAGDVNGRVEYKPQLWRYTTTNTEYINGSTSSTGLGTQDRANNSIKFISKDINGFTAHVMLNFNGATAATAPSSANANISSTYSSLGLKYNSEKLKVAYVYDQLTNADGAGYLPGYSSGQVAAKGTVITWAAHSTSTPLKRDILVASYDFGPLTGSYIMANAGVSGSGTMTTNTFGVSVPYDKFKFALSVGSGSISASTSTYTGNLADTTFGTYYNFDKSTQAYLLYSNSTYSAITGTSKTVAAGARYNF